jgi:uncharacterized repeat protein (TIGR03803 family)
MIKYIPKRRSFPGWPGQKLFMKFRTRFDSFVALALTAIVACAGIAHASDRKYRTLYTFQGGADGWLPVSVPAVDKDGNLYGGTTNGGLYGYGTIFKLTAPKKQGGKWKETVLYNPSETDNSPTFMAFGPDGVLYGTGGASNIFSLTPPKPGKRSWTYRLIYQLSETDGNGINGNPVFDADGNLYDAAGSGGNLNCGNGAGCGTVFELKRPQEENGQWQIEVLHIFTGEPDGEGPAAGLTFDQEGNLWGTTAGGGTYGGGTVYELSLPQGQGPGWTESVVYSFYYKNNYIASPQGPVTFDGSGNLFSTTEFGGDQNCQGGFGCGVVFELASPDWTYSTLYEFQGGTDGVSPMGYIVFDSQGNLYSTTEEGGGNGGPGAGVAFELSPPPNGGYWSETILHRFRSSENGGDDEGLTWGKWGDLYGVTLGGGPNGYGTVFEVSP